MSRESVPSLPRQKDEDIIVYSGESGEQELKSIIRTLNMKVTTQRMAILKALSQGRRHVTAQELFEKVYEDHPEIGFATVYRFLRTLTECNFVSELRMGGLAARYELNLKNHHDHLTCIRCGKISEFENKTIEALQEKVAKQFGFQLTHHVLELYGVCPVCQSEETLVRTK